jgi:hypothetical protein
VAFTLPRLPMDGGTDAERQVWWQEVVEAIEAQEGRQDDAIAAIAAAQAAADAANTAAAAADAAAASAQSTADDITAVNALGTSYVTGVTITATDAGADVTITVSAHTRHYPQPDGSTVDVAVSGGNLTGRAYSTTYYVYYDDAARAGGAVTYQTTTSEATAAQIGDRHTVGGVETPAAAGPPKTGGYTSPPGPGQIGQIP